MKVIEFKLAVFENLVLFAISHINPEVLSFMRRYPDQAKITLPSTAMTVEGGNCFDLNNDKLVLPIHPGEVFGVATLRMPCTEESPDGVRNAIMFADRLKRTLAEWASLIRGRYHMDIGDLPKDFNIGATYSL